MIGLLSAEVRKLTTTKTVYWLLLLAVVLAAGITALIIFFTTSAIPGATSSTAQLGSIEFTRQVLGDLTGQSGARVIMLCIGVLALGAEFRHNTITPTLLATPRRGRVVAAKLAIVVLTGVVFAIFVIGAGLAVYLIWMRAKGAHVALTEDGFLRVLLGNGLVMVLYGAIGMGLGVLIRNMIAAMICGILYAWLLDSLLALALNAVKSLRDAGVPGYLPGQAASALQWASQGQSGADQPVVTQIHLLPQWGGGLVLAGWAALFCILGVSLALSKDIT